MFEITSESNYRRAVQGDEATFWMQACAELC